VKETNSSVMVAPLMVDTGSDSPVGRKSNGANRCKSRASSSRGFLRSPNHPSHSAHQRFPHKPNWDPNVHPSFSNSPFNHRGPDGIMALPQVVLPSYENQTTEIWHEEYARLSASGPRSPTASSRYMGDPSHTARPQSQQARPPRMFRSRTSRQPRAKTSLQSRPVFSRGQSLIDPTRPVQPLTENETFSFELLRKTLPIEERTLVEQWLRDRQIVFAKQKFAQEKEEAKEAEQKLIAEALRIKEVARKQKIRQRKMAEQSKREEEEAQR